MTPEKDTSHFIKIPLVKGVDEWNVEGRSMNSEKQKQFGALLRESSTMGGALGALAYTALKGLQWEGAPNDALEGIRLLMEEHFTQLSDQQCNTRCDVLYQRLGEEAQNKERRYGTSL